MRENKDKKRIKRTIQYNATSNTFDITDQPQIVYDIKNNEDKRRTVST